MGIIDVIKRAFEVCNKNLMLVLVNVLLYVIVFGVFLVGGIIFAILAAGPLAALPDNPQEIEGLMDNLAMSAGIIVVMIAAGVAVAIMFWAAYSFIQAGSFGTLIATAKGRIQKFEWSVFWDNLKRFGLSILWLNILWGLIAIGILLALGIIGLIGTFGVLLPLKEADNTAAAFGFGIPFIALLVLTYMFCMFLIYAGAMTSGVTVVDKQKDAMSAMSDALAFIKEQFWDVVVLVLIVVALSFSVSVVFAIVRTIFSIIPVIGPIISLVFIMPVEMCVNLYIAIFIMSCFTVMLLDRTGGLQAASGLARIEPRSSAAPAPPIAPAGPTGPPSSFDTGLPGAQTSPSPSSGGFGGYPPEPTPPPAAPAPESGPDDFSFIPETPSARPAPSGPGVIAPPFGEPEGPRPHAYPVPPEPPQRPFQTAAQQPQTGTHTPPEQRSPLQRPPLQRPSPPERPVRPSGPDDPPVPKPKPPADPPNDGGEGD